MQIVLFQFFSKHCNFSMNTGGFVCATYKALECLRNFRLWLHLSFGYFGLDQKSMLMNKDIASEFDLIEPNMSSVNRHLMNEFSGRFK